MRCVDTRRRRALSALVTTLCLVLVSHTAPAAERSALAHNLGNDLFVAGSEVRVTDGSAGDAILAGGRVSSSGAVQGDEVATGGEVNLDADVAGGLYAAGGRVRVDGKVARNARIAGGHVELGPDAGVQGALSIGGGEVTVEGHVGKYLQVGAGRTRIDGHVDGNVDVTSGELNVGPHAVIDGVLTYYGPQPAVIADGAQIRGGTHYIERSHWKRLGHHRGLGTGSWIWLAGWIVAGTILLALWPGFAHAVSEVARNQLWLALLLGFGVLVCVPVALVFLMLTIVGIPLALLLLFAYLLLLPLGYLASAAAIGEWLLARMRSGVQLVTRDRILVLIGVLIGVLIVLFLLTRVPLLGGALRFLLIIAGVGSLVIASAARHRAPA